jgi:hypothetical protein
MLTMLIDVVIEEPLIEEKEVKKKQFMEDSGKDCTTQATHKDWNILTFPNNLYQDASKINSKINVSKAIVTRLNFTKIPLAKGKVRKKLSNLRS